VGKFAQRTKVTRNLGVIRAMLRFWKAAIGLAVLMVLAAAPARAEWRRAESPNFIVYGNASESQLRARILLLEDFDRLLRMLASGEQAPAPKLHVYIVSGIDDLRVIRPVPDGVAGYYIATDDGIAAFVDGRAEGRGNQILLHEYTHHFMSQHMPSAYPTWYVEGFAEYFATVRFTARRIDIGTHSQGRAYAILEGQWLPMERILSGGIDGLSQQAMSLYYAQSWLLVHYFYSTPERQAALARLLRASRRGGNAVEALQAATGLTPQGLTEQLRRYIGGGQIAYRQAPRASADTPVPVTITVMPPSAAEMVIYEAALRVGVLPDNEQPYLQRIRIAAARFPDDPLAMRVLAHAELRHGDGATADRLLDRLLASSPNDAELLYLKGMRYLLAAQGDNPPDDAAANARIWFGRARAADPNNFQTLIRYVESLRGEPGYASDETRDLLVRASQLAPQVASITFNTAGVLIARRDYDQAIGLLAPLAVNPHDQGLANAARRLMAQAIERQMNERGRAPPTAPGPDGAPPPDKD